MKAGDMSNATAPETWRSIPGYESTYIISTLGRIMSVPRRRTKGGILKAHTGKRGYTVVGLVQDGIQTTHEVHRLVALTFIGPRPEGMEVCHLNGDRTDPRLENLSYGSRSENVLDKRAHGTDHNVNKTQCPQGHPYDDENTYVLPSRPNARYCRICQRERSLRRYHASRAS